MSSHPDVIGAIYDSDTPPSWSKNHAEVFIYQERAFIKSMAARGKWNVLRTLHRFTADGARRWDDHVNPLSFRLLIEALANQAGVDL